MTHPMKIYYNQYILLQLLSIISGLARSILTLKTQSNQSHDREKQSLSFCKIAKSCLQGMDYYATRQAEAWISGNLKNRMTLDSWIDLQNQTPRNRDVGLV